MDRGLRNCPRETEVSARALRYLLLAATFGPMRLSIGARKEMWLVAKAARKEAEAKRRLLNFRLSDAAGPELESARLVADHGEYYRLTATGCDWVKERSSIEGEEREFAELALGPFIEQYGKSPSSKWQISFRDGEGEDLGLGDDEFHIGLGLLEKMGLLERRSGGFGLTLNGQRVCRSPELLVSAHYRSGITPPIPVKSADPGSAARFQVFLSSTFSDLRAIREELILELLKSSYIPAGMEWFPATTDRGWEIIQRTIDQSDYYVLVVAGRYGTSGDDGVSWTEREYEYAKSAQMPILVFIQGDDSITASVMERDPTKAAQLQNFKAKLKQSHHVKEFSNGSDLSRMVLQALINERDNGPRRPGWIRGVPA